MADSLDSRQSSRYLIVLPVFYTPKGAAAAKPGTGRTCSLSEGGACLELVEAIVPATPMDLALQTEQGRLQLGAEVVWVGMPGVAAGGILHGVTFTEVTADQRQALRALLRDQARARWRAVRVPARLLVRCRLLGARGGPWHCWVDDLSREGCALRLPERLTAGVAVEIGLATPHGEFTAEATVTWVEPPERIPSEKLIRHGLRFTAPAWVRELVFGLALEEVPTGDEPPAEVD